FFAGSCTLRSLRGHISRVENAAEIAMEHQTRSAVWCRCHASETMRQSGVDMSTKYKETSEGGLAVNVVEC
ncbi:MAG: L-serine ammonia-lyase, partial [Mycetocola sp.]|nr:L-serine ammonia-lyase [Mycetocola sp.]